MTKRFCDVCGKEMDSETTVSQFRITANNRIFTDIKGRKWSDIYCTEVCEKCTKEIAATVMKYINEKGGQYGMMA